MSDAFWMALFAFLTATFGSVIQMKRMGSIQKKQVTMEEKQEETHVLVNGGRERLEAECKALREENYRLRQAKD